MQIKAGVALAAWLCPVQPHTSMGSEPTAVAAGNKTAPRVQGQVGSPPTALPAAQHRDRVCLCPECQCQLHLGVWMDLFPTAQTHDK